VHLCEDHARTYLTQPEELDKPDSIASVLSHNMQVGQTAEELARLDQRACPVCGITFFEFRHQGKFGCPHDYVCFEEELEPVIVNIHGETTHTGKRPRRCSVGVDRKTDLIRLRREMKDAVEKEDYERAVRLRDEIREIEQEGSAS
jgi:protein arginine kinase activator